MVTCSFCVVDAPCDIHKSNPTPIDNLKNHIDKCPLDWVDNKLTKGNWTSLNEILDWIKNLKELKNKL